MSVQIGPLALPIAPLWLLIVLALCAWLAVRISPAREQSGVDTAVWTAAMVGLVVARIGHLVAHAEVYRLQPLSGLDIRDGGFLAVPGIAAGGLVLAWMVWRNHVRVSGPAADQVPPGTRNPPNLRTSGESGQSAAPSSESGQSAAPSTQTGVWRVGLLAIGATVLWWAGSMALQSLGPAGRLQLDTLTTALEMVRGGHTGAEAPLEQAPSTSGAQSPADRRLTLAQIAQNPSPRPLVVNLWATWCAPCRAEMPIFAKVQRERPDVQFAFVNQGEALAPIEAYLQRESLDLRSVWRDPGSAVGAAVGSSGLPTTLVFDAQGRLVKMHLGVLSEAALRILLIAAMEK